MRRWFVFEFLWASRYERELNSNLLVRIIYTDNVGTACAGARSAIFRQDNAMQSKL